MLDSFKNYINLLLCLGIFVTILQLIIPKNSSRKYIYSFVGIIMIIGILSPVINFLKNGDVKTQISEVLSNFDEYNDQSSEYTNYASSSIDVVKNQMIYNMKEDITKKLSEKNINIVDIQIYLEESYDVSKISLKIENLKKNNSNFSDLNDVVKYINEEYQIEYSKIEVIEEG